MKRVLFLSAIAVGLLVVFTGCKQATSETPATVAAVITPATYTMSVLPAKFSATIPASILPASTAAPSYRATITATAGAVSNGSTMIKSLTMSMKSLSGFSGLFAIIADAAISQNPTKFTGTNGATQTVTVKLTKEMADSIASVAGCSMDLGSSIGQSASISLSYINNDTDITYPNKAIISSADLGAMTTTIQWNAAKNKSKLTLIMEGSTISLAYDSAAKQTVMKLTTAATANSPSMAFNMGLKEQTSGVLFYCTSNITTILQGMADDNGGYINITSGGISAYDEYFNAAGFVIAANAAYSTASQTAALQALATAVN